MFAAVFAFALIAGNYVTAEIPSYIHVCNRRDPQLDLCIVNNIDNIKDKICEGIPELDIQPNNPFVFDEIIISDTPNSKIFFRDVKITRLCDFVIKYFHIDLDTLHFDVEIVFKQLQINGTYHFDVRLLVPFVNTGSSYITTDNVEAKVNMDMHIVTKNDKRYVYMSKLKLNLDIKGYDVENGSDNATLNQLNQIISNFIGNNQEEVIKAFKPVIEKQVVKWILSVSNNIVKHFTFEELFPEQK